MQMSIRFYITQSDDQPVVRTVPVTVRPVAQANETAAPTTQAEPAAVDGRARVARLMRAATRRAQATR
jgi:hypothetical protein